MGLDMYLYADKYVSKYSDPEKAKAIKELFPEIPPSNNLDSVNIEIEVAYWRKANAIHKWFVNNVQEGEDDCESYFVSNQKLKELYDTCVAIKTDLEKEGNAYETEIENGYSFKDGVKIPNMIKGIAYRDTSLAEELLPPSSGFFFGSTNIDQWYKEEIDYTVKVLEKLIELKTDFKYQSSW